MKYKIGDKVRVREDLEVGKIYGKVFFNGLMATQVGKIVTIEEVDEPFYYIKEVEYVWTEEMFSGLAEEPRNLIPLIAKELGVEIGERFKVNNASGTFYFENYYLQEENLNNFISGNDSTRLNAILSELINGHWKIEKLPPKPKLTEAERVILENLPKEYKWIARDLSKNIINVFYEKPQKRTVGLKVWSAPADNEELYVYNHLFQFIKWEDKEPYNIEELLEEYERGKK